MSEPQLANIEPLGEGEWASGTWIIVLNAHQTPPHIGLIEGGIYHSVDHNGYHRFTMDKLDRLIETKRIPTLACKIGSEDKRVAQEVFVGYDVLMGDITCLYPVRDFCKLHVLYDSREANYVFELIPKLVNENRIECSRHLHLGDHLSDGVFSFPTYSKQEILDRIMRLRESS